MKYTIMGFQQEKLLEFKLTTDDALLLNSIKDMYGSATMEFKEFNGTRYMWINYTWLLKQIPILGSKRKLMDRIKKYSEEDLLLRVLQKEKNGVRGNYAYISPTKKLFELQDYTPYANSAQGLCKDSTRVMQNLHNKDTPITDTPITDNKHLKPIVQKDLNVLFIDFWNLYDKKTGKPKCESKWKKLTDQERLEIMAYIPKYKRNTPDKTYRKHPMTFLNGRAWEDEIVEKRSFAPKQKPAFESGAARRLREMEENNIKDAEVI